MCAAFSTPQHNDF